MMRQVGKGNIQLHPRREILDIVLIDGKARGVIGRDIVTGDIERHVADAVILASGGYGNVFFLSTNAMASNVGAAWKAYKKGAGFANPCFTQIHPTCIPVSGDHQSKLTLMSESLRNDGRVWVPKAKGDKRHPNEIPEEERDYYLERIYPSFGNLVPRDVASRNAKLQADDGKGVGATGIAVYLDFAAAIKRDGKDEIEAKYGNLFEMYQRITDESPYEQPMKIYPAVHYTMGGLWVDYNLQSTIPGLHVLGEANFSDHGANRLGASALMQGLADGYFVLPYTLGQYCGTNEITKVDTTHTEFQKAEDEAKGRINKLLAINGTRTSDDFHRALGKIMWEHVGMARNEPGLKTAIKEIQALQKEFWEDLKVTGTTEGVNTELEKAGRVCDFLELGELMARDALMRPESCGGHFREESQTDENEALRDDENFAHSAVWEFTGQGNEPERNKEELTFENVTLTQRSYK
jgi:succinate dehydrogenase / fumarate reductase flavoprotein subunit